MCSVKKGTVKFTTSEKHKQHSQDEPTAQVVTYRKKNQLPLCVLTLKGSDQFLDIYLYK